MPTPMSAVSSGSPAAISEPKVMTRTTAAIAMPMISVAPVSGIACSASPPISHRQPRVPAVLRRVLERVLGGVGQLHAGDLVADLRVRGGAVLADGLRLRTGRRPRRPARSPDFRSRDGPARPPPCWPGRSSSGRRARWKTTRAVAPSALAPGNRWSSRSKAFWASVPGMEKELEVAEDAVAAPTPRDGEQRHPYQGDERRVAGRRAGRVCRGMWPRGAVLPSDRGAYEGSAEPARRRERRVRIRGCGWWVAGGWVRRRGRGGPRRRCRRTRNAWSTAAVLDRA